MKTAAIIQARMTSTRLPGKIMKPILGKPVLELMIERLRRSDVDDIIVATTDKSTDDVTEALAGRLGVRCYRGSEDDVLRRVLEAAKWNGVDVIVEVTGDCPLIEPSVIDSLISIYRIGRYDYVSNVLKRTFPRGLDVQVFSVVTLMKVAELTQDAVDHEHVSLYIYEHPETFSLYNLESGLPEKYWDYRLTVDTIEDFQLIEAIYENLYTSNPNFTIIDVIHLLDEKPELLNLNRDITQKATR
jgi:spore coat polysaccharide biosynthesis protein SpsF